jgi:HEAT repeat protein
LLQEVASDDANVRRRAIAALGNVASPEDVGGLIKGLLAIKDAGERDEAGRAVAAVCGRAADESRQAEPVLSAYDKASPAQQLLLLPILGRLGGEKSLTLVRQAVSSPDEARRQSGQQALFNWPDSAVASDLAQLAETTGDKDLKTRAVRELARVVVLPGSLSNDDRLALLRRGFDQASRNEEKRLFLDRAREVHSFAAVTFAAAHMAEPRLASQAIATVVDLLHRDEIRKPNQAAADTILDQVIKLSKDKSLVERAKSFKATK